MSTLIIDGQILKKAIIAGANQLKKNREYIDSLNVFPVPDGDTGVNMSMTALAAANEVAKLDTKDIYEVAKAASNGSLRGARGNSGVILSQLFRGFAKGLEGKSTANQQDLSEAFIKAAEAAYKAVMKPKEGTILTVAKSLGESSIEGAINENNIEDMIKHMLEKGHQTLIKTQFMLPELKQAGVVDAGGMGLMYILEGALASKDVEGEIKVSTLNNNDTSETTIVANPVAISKSANIEFGYCTEFFINIGTNSKVKAYEEVEDSLKKYLETMGDSIVVVGDEDIVKIHVHTNNPGAVLEKAITIGEISNIKIENMREQHTAMVSFIEDSENGTTKEKEVPHKDTAFISVATGSGIKDLFKKLGVDNIIEGGQTMNPSTETFLSAIEAINANNIVILPNNKNIILAAEQAAKLCENKTVYVLPTETVPQGIASLVSYVKDFDIEQNLKQMKAAMSNIKTGQVTYAVRDTTLDEKEIKNGDILCLLEGKISNVNKDIKEGTKDLIDTMFKAYSPEIISIYYGEDQTEAEANDIAAYIEDNYEDCEIEVFSGGQPLYYYIISVE